MFKLRSKRDKYHRYSQTNNPEEELLRKVGVKGYLETCGPSAFCSCLSAVGYKLEIETPGGYKHQPESLLTSFFNDFRNYKRFKDIRPNLDPSKIPGNRVPQYYPEAALKIWNIKNVFFAWKLSWGYVSNFARMKNYAVMICLKKPGHYIAVIDYDKKQNAFVYNDSWGNRKGLKNGGHAELMFEKEFDKNVQPFVIVVWNPDKTEKYNEVR